MPRAALLRGGFVLLAAGLAGTAAVAVPGRRRLVRLRRPGPSPGSAWASGCRASSVLLLDQSPEDRRGADSAAFQIADVTGSALCVGVVGVLVGAAAGGAAAAVRTAVLLAVAVLSALAVLGAVLAPRAGAPVAARERPAVPRLPWRTS